MSGHLVLRNNSFARLLLLGLPSTGAASSMCQLRKSAGLFRLERECYSNTMVKRELVEEVMQRYSQFSKKEAEVVVNEVFACMTEALAQGERVELRGFGVFEVRQREARNGHNPRTGATIAVAAKRVPFFKASKELRERVNGETA